MPLIESHHATTGLTAQTVVADSKYGTIDNFLDCWDKGIYAHMPDYEKSQRNGPPKEYFLQQQFQYDPQNDLFAARRVMR